MYFADCGATVVRIETISHVDSLRIAQPFKDDIPGVNRSGLWANYNRNKYSITLNLNRPQGINVTKRLISWADVVVESFTPGTMKKWGLDYENLKRINPSIIMLSTCMQGQTGPHSRHPGYGFQMVALSGIAQVTGWPDREPLSLYAYTDLIAPPLGVAALAAALDYRRRTGKGQYLDLSQYEASVHFIAPLALDYTVNGHVAERAGNSCPYAAPHGAYPCRGKDRWVVIAVFSDEEWKAFSRVIGNPEWTKNTKFSTLLNRRKNEDELDRLVGEWTRSFTAEEVMTMLQSEGVAAGVVQNAEDIQNDPQFKYRHHLQKLEHPEIGWHSCDSLPFQLSETPAELKTSAPCLGEHTHYVFTKMLNISDKEFVELDAAGAFE